MKLYVDASVALRIVLGQPDPLREWFEFQEYVASALLRVECFRAVHRFTFEHRRAAAEVAGRLGILHDFLRRIDLAPVAPAVLDRAAEPFPVPLKTLDAIHLVTAVSLRDLNKTDLVFATHDRSLGAAARAVDLRVVGCQET